MVLLRVFPILAVPFTPTQPCLLVLVHACMATGPLQFNMLLSLVKLEGRMVPPMLYLALGFVLQLAATYAKAATISRPSSPRREWCG